MARSITASGWFIRLGDMIAADWAVFCFSAGAATLAGNLSTKVGGDPVGGKQPLVADHLTLDSHRY
jgi:hypothetical protein